jgi:hypothetical protein
MTFQEQIQQGIPTILPQPKPYEVDINHAPKRKEIYRQRKKLALRNALRYFEAEHHAELIQEFDKNRNLRTHIHVSLSSRLRNACVPLMNIQVNVSRRKPLC